MSSSKKAFGGLFWNLSGNVLNVAYTLFSVPILLHHFGKEQYGLIGLAFQINVYLQLMDMGLASGNIRFFSKWIAQGKLSRVSKLFQSSLVFYGVIGIVNVFILGVCAYLSQWMWHLDNAQAVIMHRLFYVLMISAFFGWISTLFDQFLKANEILGWEQRLLIFIKIIQLIILYLTLRLDLSVTIYFMLACFASLLIFPFTILRIRRLKNKVSFVPKYYRRIFMAVLPYSLSAFGVQIFQFSATTLRPLILSFRSGINPFADYRILNGFASTIMTMSVGFVGILIPMATKAVASGNTSSRDKIAYQGTKYLTIFLSLIVFGFVLVSKDVLCMWVGDKYAYLDPWLKLWVLTMLFSHTSAISSLVFAENRLMPVMYISAFSATTSLILAWYLVPQYQVGGIIISYLFYCISQITFYYSYYYRKVLRLDIGRILFRSFFTPAVLLCICAVAAHYSVSFFVLNGRVGRILATGSAFIIFSCPIVFFVLLNADDKMFIKRLLSRRKEPAG